MSDPAQKLLTVDEFLAWDDGTDRRYELLAGSIVAMAPASDTHARMIGRLARLIDNGLAPPLDLAIGAGILIPDKADTFYVADIVVTCSPPTRSPWTPDPVAIIEIGSPSTEQHDRGVKLPDYRAIPSAQDVLLVSSTTRRLEHWRREGEAWTAIDRIASGALALASIGVEVDLAALYQGLLD